MEFRNEVCVTAPVEAVWGLMDDLESVARCIPGVSDLVMDGPRAFGCRLTQRLGPIKASFRLTNTVVEDDREAFPRTVVVTSSGRDDHLKSTLHAVQHFTMREREDGATQIAIAAVIDVTGRVATFGNGVMLARAEQVTVEAIANVSAMLEARSSTAT
jgi:carbon monoxide dehydrogenase subunit G